MKLKILLLSVFFSFFLKSSFSQIDYSVFIGGDFGFSFVDNQLPDKVDFIRRNVANYGGYYSYHNDNNYGSNSVNTRFDGVHFSLKTEYLFFENRIGVGAGIRYSNYSCSLGNDNSGFYYVRLEESGTNTKYLRILGIDQTINNIGIPLEVRFFPYKASVVRLYFKVGCELNFNVNTVTKVAFVDETMNSNSQDVINMFDKPAAINPVFNSALGIRFCKEDKFPEVSFEIGYTNFINPNVSSLIKAGSGVGMQIIVQIPLNVKEEKL